MGNLIILLSAKAYLWPMILGGLEFTRTLYKCSLTDQDMRWTERITREHQYLISDNEKALIVGQIRRILSATAVKAQVQCLLARLHQVGPGNKQLAKRRQWAVLQDEKMKKERHSQWIRRIEGVNTLRKGMIRIA